MGDPHKRPRSTTIVGLLFSCCFYGSDDERSLLPLSLFQKVRRSNPGADLVDANSQNWWRKSWKSVRRVGDWSESVINDVGSCCSGPKWKYFVRRFKADGKTIYSSRPSRFQYDPPSYELNFDDGLQHAEDHQFQGLSLSTVKLEQSAGAGNPRKSLKDTQNLQVIRPCMS